MNETVKRRVIYSVLAVVIFILAVIAFNYHESSKMGERVSELANAKYPVMAVGSDSADYNKMSAYVSKVDLSVVRNRYTVLGENRTLKLKLHNYGYDITAIHYNLFESDPQDPTEKGTINKLTANKKEGVREGTINFKTNIEQGKTYYLRLSVRLNDSQVVYYYTKLVNGSGYGLDDYLTFAKNFHEATLNRDNFNKDYSSYLETDINKQVNTLQNINIKSSSEMVTYGTMVVKEEGTPRFEVCEINGTYAVLRLRSILSCQIAEGLVQYYDVDETFKMRYTPQRMYLLDYQRSMNSYYNKDMIDSANNYIGLGIHAADKIDYKSADGGKKVCFVSEGQLWYYDYNNSNVMQVYSSFSDNIADLRNDNDEQGIKVLKFNKKGDITYLVYGYINRGSREGYNGIEIVHYDASSNTNRELAFLKTSAPYESMDNDIGYFSYLSKDNVFYCQVDGDFHEVDLKKGKDKILRSGIVNDSLTASKQQNIIAITSSKEKEDNTEIDMIDLETGKKKTFTADSDERICSVGFLSNDFIYGVADAKDVHIKRSGAVEFPIKILHIVNIDGKEIRNYSKAGRYITDMKIEGNVLEMRFSAKKGSRFVKTSQTDYIRYKEDENNRVSLTTEYSTVYYTQLYMRFPSDVYVQVEPDLVSSRVVMDKPRKVVTLKRSGKSALQYYVYASGVKKDVYTDLTDAILAADEARGIVIDSRENVLWQCIFEDYDQVAGMDQVEKVASDKYSLAGCLAMIAGVNGKTARADLIYHDIKKNPKSMSKLIQEYSGKRALNLNGCTTDEILYYISKGSPVLAKLTQNRYVIVMSYNQTKIRYLDPVTGNSTAENRDTVAGELKKAGNRFYSYLPQQ
ncbi:MAG: hypothetical protein U0K57_10265 [Lachnospiraceae bacterium]|nr:hypothetical protein [Lachnospiraceae bacterium]